MVFSLKNNPTIFGYPHDYEMETVISRLYHKSWNWYHVDHVIMKLTMDHQNQFQSYHFHCRTNHGDSSKSSHSSHVVPWVWIDSPSGNSASSAASQWFYSPLSNAAAPVSRRLGEGGWATIRMWSESPNEGHYYAKWGRVNRWYGHLMPLASTSPFHSITDILCSSNDEMRGRSSPLLDYHSMTNW